MNINLSPETGDIFFKIPGLMILSSISSSLYRFRMESIGFHLEKEHL